MNGYNRRCRAFRTYPGTPVPEERWAASVGCCTWFGSFRLVGTWVLALLQAVYSVLPLLGIRGLPVWISPAAVLLRLLTRFACLRVVKAKANGASLDGISGAHISDGSSGTSVTANLAILVHFQIAAHTWHPSLEGFLQSASSMRIRKESLAFLAATSCKRILTERS